MLPERMRVIRVRPFAEAEETPGGFFSQLEEMQDRLAELRGQNNPFAAPQDVQISINNGESVKTSIRPKSMEGFFQDTEAVQADIEKIWSATAAITRMDEQSVAATSVAEEHEISEQLNALIEETNRNAADAKGIIEKMKSENAKLKKDKNVESSEKRARENMYTTLTRKFMDAMKHYHKAQQTYKANIKNKVKRQVQIVKPDASNEEIDQIMRSVDHGSVYKSAILQGSADPIREAYASCQDKYQDVLRLEQSVAELHQMFLDLALLVEEQGEILDQIEHQVKSAADYMESGNEELQKAIKHQASARKKKCFLAIFGLVIIMVVTLSAGVF